MTRRKQTASERAEVIFHIHYELGPRRSLARLRRRLSEIGWPISLSTLKLYSSRDGWQQRVAQLDAEVAERKNESSVRTVMEMDERHAQLDRALQGAGGSALKRLLQDDERLSAMRPAEIVRLLELGMRDERRAVGDAATREEIALDIWNRLGEGIVPAFREEIADLPDGEERARRFRDSVNRVIEAHLSEIRTEGAR